MAHKNSDFCQKLKAAIEAAPEGVAELLRAIHAEHCAHPIVMADSGDNGPPPKRPKSPD